MEFLFLVVSLFALTVLILVVYPWVRERRERELVKRLAGSQDSTVAIIEMDRVMRQHHHEANFFRVLVKYVWPTLFR